MKITDKYKILQVEMSALVFRKFHVENCGIVQGVIFGCLSGVGTRGRVVLLSELQCSRW
jgi:hypothetical protein